MYTHAHAHVVVDERHREKEKGRRIEREWVSLEINVMQGSKSILARMIAKYSLRYTVHRRILKAILSPRGSHERSLKKNIAVNGIEGNKGFGGGFLPSLFQPLLFHARSKIWLGTCVLPRK